MLAVSCFGGVLAAFLCSAEVDPPAQLLASTARGYRGTVWLRACVWLALEAVGVALVISQMALPFGERPATLVFQCEGLTSLVCGLAIWLAQRFGSFVAAGFLFPAAMAAAIVSEWGSHRDGAIIDLAFGLVAFGALTAVGASLAPLERRRFRG